MDANEREFFWTATKEARRTRRGHETRFAMPFLTNLSVECRDDGYPFSIPAIRALESGIALHPKVTYFVGENGMGKSTLLEGLADKWGFSNHLRVNRGRHRAGGLRGNAGLPRHPTVSPRAKGDGEEAAGGGLNFYTPASARALARTSRVACFSHQSLM